MAVMSRDVSALEGVDKALHDLADALVPEGAKRRLLALLGQPIPDRPARALEGAVHRRDRRPERLRDLLRRQPEHLAEDEHGPLARRQVLERRDEGELERLALLVAGLRRGVALLQPQHLVRIRFEPDRFRKRLGRLFAVAGRRPPVVDRKDALRPAGQGVEAGVRRDPVEPAAERASPVEAAEAAPGARSAS